MTKQQTIAALHDILVNDPCLNLAIKLNNDGVTQETFHSWLQTQEFAVYPQNVTVKVQQFLRDIEVRGIEWTQNYQERIMP